MGNRAAVGVGPWLLQAGKQSSVVSLDATALLLDQKSYTEWISREWEETSDDKQALAAVLDEVWKNELNPREQAVLRGTYWKGESEAEIARSLGLHHSTVKRCRERALVKLEQELRYVLRYRALLGR